MAKVGRVNGLLFESPELLAGTVVDGAEFVGTVVVGAELVGTVVVGAELVGTVVVGAGSSSPPPPPPPPPPPSPLLGGVVVVGEGKVVVGESPEFDSGGEELSSE